MDINKEIIGKFYILDDKYSSYIYIIHGWSYLQQKYISSPIDMFLMDNGIQPYMTVVDDIDSIELMSYSDLVEYIKQLKDNPLHQIKQKLLKAYLDEAKRHRYYRYHNPNDQSSMWKAVRRCLDVNQQIKAEKRFMDEDPNELNVHNYYKALKGYRRALKPIYSKLEEDDFIIFKERVEEMTNKDIFNPLKFFKDYETETICRKTKNLDKFVERYGDLFEK